MLPRQLSYNHTIFQAFACFGLPDPYLWHIQKWCKREVHWPWTFHLCNTLSNPSSCTLSGPIKLSQGWSKLPTVLLVPNGKQYLPLFCVPRHCPSSTCNSPTSPAFLCQPNFYGVLLTMYQLCYVTFSCGVNSLLITLCWLLAFWCNSALPEFEFLKQSKGKGYICINVKISLVPFARHVLPNKFS